MTNLDFELAKKKKIRKRNTSKNKTISDDLKLGIMCMNKVAAYGYV